MGLVLPESDFLEGLRDATRRVGALFIFDEVMTGFRVGWGGAAARFGITPDIVTLGKVIGGGLPVGAYAGPRDVMEQLAPLGPVYQAGTLSGNPVVMAAGLATLELLSAPGAYDEMARLTGRLAAGLTEAAKGAGVPLQAASAGSMFGLFFNPSPVRNYEDAKASDSERYARWFHSMLVRGVYCAPSQYEAGFVSTAHDEDVIDTVLDAAGRTLEELGRP